MKIRHLMPLGIFIALVILLGIGLTLNPKEVPSPFIGKQNPGFSLPKLYNPDSNFSHEEMVGKVWIFNVFASWCVSCRAEHRLLTTYARESGVPVIGLNYKDEPGDAVDWLRQLGDPYYMIVADYDGRTGIDWGVYGVPESFVVDKKGVIRYKQIGPINPKDLEEKIKPIVKQLQGEPA